MYEVITGLPPYHNSSHDEFLALDICEGLRPSFNIRVPQIIFDLINKCLDANALNRPTAGEVHEIVDQWKTELAYDYLGDHVKEVYDKYKMIETEIREQAKESEETNNSNKSSTSAIPSTSLGISYEIHPEAIYTSRLLNFSINLPEPKNSEERYR
ncbi:uncharacterized protein OCT59_020902 [Rhizophagus irregularis]|uniref:Protein kinase domain-containing protein n=1 Tax=Rhizophagus irregularis (strain DAOM 181602 / DAOM 197198 / MUCL 43194) TaxID=747089 RepID=U9UVU0_RHIID|nr:hypothetical protein OCT59_020902 [Rhizophagus irregularis]